MTSDASVRSFLASASFVQRRLALFCGVLCALIGGLWVINAGLNAVFYPAYAGGRILSMRSMVHLGAAAWWGLLWAAMRVRAWSPRVLGASDLVGMSVTALALGAMVVLGEPRYRPEMVMSMSVAHLLVLRAAVLPSTALRTALVGAIAELPIVVASYAVHARPGRPAVLPAAASVTATLVVWAILTIATTSIISSIIYGLRRQVHEAMRLGQYTLETKLGEGGMGVVYRARHALLRRPTAIKVLSTAQADDVAFARFEREVRAAARLSHPNIVSIYDFGRSADGTFYYAMEYVEGLDLERLVRCFGAQPEGRVRQILLQTADALAEAHAAALVHRDVKPRNILICPRRGATDQVKLVDFGLVKDTAVRRTAAGPDPAVKGTPLYMAPEAITAPDTVDERSDLYGLGAVGYFLLTGAPVFEGRTMIEICARHVNEAPVPPSARLGTAMSRKLQDVIMRCLAKSKDDRPAAAAAVVDALGACDDCAAWSADDARSWWKERARQIRDDAAGPDARKPSIGRFDVQLGGRR